MFILHINRSRVVGTPFTQPQHFELYVREGLVSCSSRHNGTTPTLLLQSQLLLLLRTAAVDTHTTYGESCRNSETTTPWQPKRKAVAPQRRHCCRCAPSLLTCLHDHGAVRALVPEPVERLSGLPQTLAEIAGY